jgi:hypothetical protein
VTSLSFCILPIWPNHLSLRFDKSYVFSLNQFIQFFIGFDSPVIEVFTVLKYFKTPFVFKLSCF